MQGTKRLIPLLMAWCITARFWLRNPARLCRSETDQEGEGRNVGIPQAAQQATCPLRAARGHGAHIDSGPLFRGMSRHDQVLGKHLSAEGVAIAVKRSAEKLGYGPVPFAGHSLRAGLASAADEIGL
jgi:hypothetical protein